MPRAIKELENILTLNVDPKESAMNNWEKHYNRILMQLEHREDLLKSKLEDVRNKIFLTKIEYQEIKQKREALK